MREVVCVSIREYRPDQIEEGKEYLIDIDTLHSDYDGDWYVMTYTKDKTPVGNMKITHFRDK